MDRVFLTCSQCGESFLVSKEVKVCPNCGGKLEYDIYSKSLYSDCAIR